MNAEHIAIHEAGHVVAFKLLGVDETCVNDGITIVPNEDVGSEGAFTSENADDRREGIVLCAGFAAVRAAGLPDADAGCESDFAMAESYGDLTALKSDAIALMEKSEARKATQIVATELLERKTICGQQLDVLLSYSVGELTEDDYKGFASRFF